MLSNVQVENLASRMGIRLEGVFFKSQLKDMKLKHNKCYIINLEDQYDEDGNPNDGSHYTCFLYNKYPKKDCRDDFAYFDSYGIAPPQEVLNFCGLKEGEMPYNIVDMQSLMADCCGFFCLAFLFYVNRFEGRTLDFYRDCEHFSSLFKNLNECNDWKHNEAVLKMFFRNGPEETTLESLGFRFIPDGTNIATGIADVNSITSEC